MASNQLQQARQQLEAGNPQGCAQICQQLLFQQPSLTEARFYLGVALLQLNQASEARQALKQVSEQQPGNPLNAYYLGLACRHCEDYPAAIDHLRKAARDSQFYADATFNLGVCHNLNGDPDQAMDVFKSLLKKHPQHSLAASNLANLLEKDNRLEEAEGWVRQSLDNDPDNALALLVKGTLLRRNGALEQAKSSLQQLLASKPTVMNRSLALYQLGQCLEREENYPAAFNTFQQANENLRLNHPHGYTEPASPYHLGILLRLKNWLKQYPIEQWSATPDDQDRPVFLLGFPRSGTTLLDQILNAHPDIEVLEERDLLMEIQKRWIENNRYEELHTLSEDDIQQARALYRQAIQGLRKKPTANVVIDKLPLNSVYITLIHRLFPKARILFALRDPRDACLSCFFQGFGLVGAMPYFLDLRETARYYTATMEILTDAEQLLPLNIHRIHYEQVVVDMETQARQALAFLDLDWHPDILDYRAKAMDRHINTPSYQQVIQPLYSRSIGRWQHYRKEMEPVLSRLSDWVSHFGYEC